MSRESEIYACLYKSIPGLNVEKGLVIFYYPSFLPGSSYLNCPLAHFTFVALRSFWSGHTSFMFSLGTVFGCIFDAKERAKSPGIKK